VAIFARCLEERQHLLEEKQQQLKEAQEQASMMKRGLGRGMV